MTTKCKDCGGFGFGTTSDMLHPWREKDITCQTCGGTGEIIGQEDVMSEYVTHHHACDCREAKFAKLEADLAAAQRGIAAYKQAMSEASVRTMSTFINSRECDGWGAALSNVRKRVAELLAQEGGK